MIHAGVSEICSLFFLWINISSHRNIYIFMHIVKYIPNTYHFFNVHYVCKSKLKIRLGDKKWTNWLPGPFLRISRIDRGLNPQLTSSAPTYVNDERKIYSLGKNVKTVYYFQKMRRQRDIFIFFEWAEKWNFWDDRYVFPSNFPMCVFPCVYWTFEVVGIRSD